MQSEHWIPFDWHSPSPVVQLKLWNRKHKPNVTIALCIKEKVKVHLCTATNGLASEATCLKAQLFIMINEPKVDKYGQNYQFGI